MENNKGSFIKADDNKIINEKYIRWVKQMDECLAVCCKLDGCDKHGIHKICKINNLDSYNKLNKLFDS